MIFIGSVSYPLYLWHWPLLTFTRVIEGSEPALLVRLTAVLVSLILAWVTYRFVETPIRRARGPTAYRRLLALSLAAVALGTTVNLQAHVLARTLPNSHELAQLKWDRTLQEQKACRRKFRQRYMTYCLESTSGADHDVALIGDSIANQYFWALTKEYEPTGSNILNLGRGSCPVLRGVETTQPVKYSCLEIEVAPGN